MKNVIKLFLCLVCICSSMSITAQKFDPYNGTFINKTANSTIEAKFDLRNKKIEGEAEGTGLCYGTIEITNARGISGYDIIGVDSLDGGEPNITVVYWMFPDLAPIRVGLAYDAKNRTITLNDWEGGSYFNNITLKEKETERSKVIHNAASKIQIKPDSKTQNKTGSKPLHSTFSKPQNNPDSKTQKKTDSKYHYW